MVHHRREARLAPTEPSPDLGALRELVQSEGWRLFLALIDDAWGSDATLRKIDAALATVARGDTSAVNDTVQQIQASRREIQKVVGLPAFRISQLEPQPTSTQPYAALRRMGR